MPKIGMRNIKTAIAVLICVLTNVLLVYFLGKEEAFNWYTPFFAGIAACYSMQADATKSFRQARIRSVGSILGGYWGMGIIWIFESFIQAWAIQVGGDSFSLLLNYFIVALMIIPIIHLTVLTKQTDATFITCLTYLSVTISIRNGGLPVVIFATNRILSTLYGVFIAILVNVIAIPRHKNKNTVFICGYEGCVLNKNKINGYMKYKLNHLTFLKAKITFASSRNASVLLEHQNDIKYKLPLIVMNGAALYDVKNKVYSNVINFNQEDTNQIETLFSRENINYFAHCIEDDVLQIYINKLINTAETNYYNKFKNASYQHYIRHPRPKEINPLCYLIIEKTSKITPLVDLISKNLDVAIFVEKLDNMPEFSTLKIYNKKVLNYEFLDKHSSFKNKKIIVVGNGVCERQMMKYADVGICNENASIRTIEVATHIIHNEDNNKLIRKINQLFHKKSKALK